MTQDPNVKAFEHMAQDFFGWLNVYGWDKGVVIEKVSSMLAQVDQRGFERGVEASAEEIAAAAATLAGLTAHVEFGGTLTRIQSECARQVQNALLECADAIRQLIAPEREGRDG